MGKSNNPGNGISPAAVPYGGCWSPAAQPQLLPRGTSERLLLVKLGTVNCGLIPILAFPWLSDFSNSAHQDWLTPCQGPCTGTIPNQQHPEALLVALQAQRAACMAPDTDSPRVSMAIAVFLNTPHQILPLPSYPATYCKYYTYTCL